MLRFGCTHLSFKAILDGREGPRKQPSGKCSVGIGPGAGEHPSSKGGAGERPSATANAGDHHSSAGASSEHQCYRWCR